MRSSVKTVTRVAALVIATAGLCGTASANDDEPGSHTTQSCPSQNVPEIDPGSAAGALTLLDGGVLRLADRRLSKAP